MAQVSRQEMNDLAAVMKDAARGLSPRAVATLVAHPDAVRSALAVAADAIGKLQAEVIGGSEPKLVGSAKAMHQIDARSQPGQQEELLTSDELAASAGLKTRQSVHDWRKKGRVIGWQHSKRGYVFPAEQLDRHGQPPKALERVVACFADGYAAWIWLTTPSAALDGEKPLSCLRKGRVDLVVEAARGDAQGDFA